MESIANSRLTKYSPGAMGGTPVGGIKPSGRPGSGGGPGGETFFRPEVKKTDAKGSTEMLRFPLGVDTKDDQGHYIIFEVWQTKPAQLMTRQMAAQGGQAVVKAQEKAKAELNTANSNVAMDLGGVGGFGGDGTLSGSVATAINQTRKKGKPNSLQVKTPATADTVAFAALYMPPSVQVSYGANYGETEIGVIAESVNEGLKAFMGAGGMANFGHALTVGGTTAGTMAATASTNWMKEKLPAGGEAILNINSGSIITPRMELMFEGIQRRTFSFDFTFIPRSGVEAIEVEKIVKMFKYHMSSDYAGNGMAGVDGVREMTIPNFFQIKYMFRGDPNNHIHKFKQCVLTKADVNYGADRYKAFETGQPQTTKLTLNFMEMEFITRTYVDQGY